MIKERTEVYGVIREKHANHSLAYFERLFQEAKKDFPALEAKDVQIVKYGGDNFGTWGIEFKIPEGAVVPDDYVRIYEMELTR